MNQNKTGDVDGMIPAFNVMDRALKMQKRADEIAAEWREIDARYPRASTTPIPSHAFEGLPAEQQQHILSLQKKGFAPRTCGVVPTPIGSYVRYVDPDAKGQREKELHNTVWRVDDIRHGHLICRGMNLGGSDLIDPFCVRPYEPMIGDYVLHDGGGWWLGKQYTEDACFWVINRGLRSRPHCGAPPDPLIGYRPSNIADGYTVVNAKCGFAGRIEFYRTIGGSGRIGGLEGFTRGINVYPDHYKLIPYLGVFMDVFMHPYGEETYAIDAFVRKLAARGDLEACLPNG